MSGQRLQDTLARIDEMLERQRKIASDPQALAELPDASDEVRLAAGWRQQTAQDVRPDGTVSRGRVFVKAGDEAPDGSVATHNRHVAVRAEVPPPHGFEVAPGPAGCWRILGLAHEACEDGPESHVEFVRWVRPVGGVE